MATFLLVVGQLRPGRDPLRTGRQLAVLGHDAQLLLVRQRRLAQRVPALVELAFVLVAPLRRDVMRRMRGAEREIDEERLVGGQRLLRLHPGDGVVHQVRRQVIVRVVRRLDRRWCRR